MIVDKELWRDTRFAAGIALGQPFQCLVQVTNRCNMTCSFCDFWPHGAPAHEELSPGEYRGLARALDAIGCFLVSIEGGEPLLRPDLVEIVAAFGERHLPVLFSNGWLMTSAIARDVYAAGVAQVGISIDFPDDRHDRKRGHKGAFERARRALDLLTAAAPHGGRQVHVMTVLMRENEADLEALLSLSAAHGVGHQVTLISQEGFRRGRRSELDALPTAGIGARLAELRERHPHLRSFRHYLAGLDGFLDSQPQGRCRAGELTFNVDHLGNVAPCIEKIDHVVGNLRRTPLGEILRKMRGLDEVRGCQDCWTYCRGFAQALGERRHADAWVDLATRMRSR